MKQLFLLVLTIVFVAASCNKSPSEPNSIEVTPSPQPPAYETLDESGDVLIYKNIYFDYEITFPKEAELTYTTPRSRIGTEDPEVLQQEADIFLGGEEANLIIRVYLTSLSKFYRIDDDTLFGRNGSYKQITINGYKAWVNQDYGTGGSWFITTVFFGNKYTYVIEYSNRNKNKKYIDVQDQMLKSFKYNN